MAQCLEALATSPPCKGPAKPINGGSRLAKFSTPLVWRKTGGPPSRGFYTHKAGGSFPTKKGTKGETQLGLGMVLKTKPKGQATLRDSWMKVAKKGTLKNKQAIKQTTKQTNKQTNKNTPTHTHTHSHTQSSTLPPQL